jgi:hypothetical protein
LSLFVVFPVFVVFCMNETLSAYFGLVKQLVKKCEIFRDKWISI